MSAAIPNLAAMTQPESVIGELPHALFKQIFDRSPDAMMLLGESGLLDCNQSALDMMGYSRADFLMLHPAQLSPKHQPDGQLSTHKANEMIALAFANGHHRFEWIHQRCNGDCFWVEVLLTCLTLNQQPVIHATLREISDRKSAEEALQQQTQELEQTLQVLQSTQLQMLQSERMSSLGQLVAGLAHEINNPVSFIYGNISPAQQYMQDLLNLIALYQQQFPQPGTVIQQELEAIDLEFVQEDFPQLFASMKMGADRIRQIILSLRNFSRLDESDYKGVNIHDGIESTLVILASRFKGQIDRPDIELIKEYGELPWVECYAGQINQVLMNILTNALDALDDRDQKRSRKQIADAPSQITIRTGRVKGDRIRVMVIDNGPGMSEETQRRIFDPFFTTKPVGQGTGMGLPISYQIITEHHHGELKCESVLGQGTTVAFEIPLRQVGCFEPAHCL